MNAIVGEHDYVLYSYEDSHGNFDYERYRRIQEEGNRRKIQNVWVLKENIAFLSTYIRRTVGVPVFGICHGTRRGNEQKWFRECLGCEVIGTEISDTASDFPDTIQWDFHEVRAEWVGAVDFIYSNSLDHSYDPEKCLNQWIRCLQSGGICILEHSTLHGATNTSELDPFGADIALMPYLITKWGSGRYCVRELLDAPRLPENVDQVTFIIIQRVSGQMK